MKKCCLYLAALMFVLFLIVPPTISAKSVSGKGKYTIATGDLPETILKNKDYVVKIDVKPILDKTKGYSYRVTAKLKAKSMGITYTVKTVSGTTNLQDVNAPAKSIPLDSATIYYSTKFIQSSTPMWWEIEGYFLSGALVKVGKDTYSTTQVNVTKK
jgi:hypothetical protein